MSLPSNQTRGSIWKFELAHDSEVEMPAGAKVMSVAWRKSRVVLWALVDPEVPKVKRRVKLLSTGNEISGEGWEFAGTALAPRDRIFHVFLEIV